MAVRAVTAVDGVVRAQLPAHADRDGLLADAQVHEPVHLVAAGQLADALLEDADPPHRPQELEADVAVEPAGAVAGYGRAGQVRLLGGDGRSDRRCTAATIFASSGRRYCSIGSLYGNGRVQRRDELHGRLQRREALARPPPPR